MKKTFYLLLTFLLCFVLMGNVKAVEKPVTPTIGSASDSFTYYELGKYYYEVGVNITDYLTQEETYTADGYELYYVVGPCKVNNSCQETLNGGYGIDEVAQIGLELGDSKTIVARVYVLDQSNERIYSDYSNELVISNSGMPTPTLSNPYNGPVAYADGIYMYDLGINSSNYLIDGCDDAYFVDGYELCEKGTDVCTRHNMGDAANLYLDANETKIYYARVYIQYEGGEREYSPNSNELSVSTVMSAPVLSNPYSGPIGYENGVYTFDLGVNASAYLFAGTEDEFFVDGYELCEKGTNVCSRFDMGAAANLNLEANVTKTYFARVYSQKPGGERIYSPSSNELEISTTIRIPDFTNGYANYDDPNTDYDKPFVGYENGIYLYDLKIDQTKYQFPGTGESQDPSDLPVYYIDGYEVCEVGKTTCTSYDVDGAAPTEVPAGEVMTLHARAFTLDAESHKTYSAWSNEVVLDTTINPPLFDEEADNVQMSNGKYVYTKAIQFDKYKYLNRNTDQLEYYVDGYEFCETDGICSRHDLEDEVTVTMNPGETKTYFARAYAQDTAGNRTYSAVSNLTIENNNISIEDVVADFNNGEIIEIFNSLGASLGARAEGNKVITYGVDENDQTVDVLAFTFDENSINYSDLESEITEEKAIMSLSSEIMVLQMIESVFSAAGYNGYMITDDTIFGENDSYETKGLLIKEEEFELSSGTEEEGRSVISGTYLRQFKMSTNKNVIANIVKNYAEEMSKEITEAPKVKVSKGNNNSLVLTWAEDRHADGYKVYRSESKNGKYKKIATVTEGTYTDKKLTYGKTYYYKVKAYNEESGKTSSIVSKKVTPNKVENLSGKPSGSTKVKLSWDKVSATGYEVYRSTDNKKWSRIVTLTTSKSITYTNKYLKSNKKYYYKVRAYKTVNGRRVYGKYSDVVLVKTAPTSPKITVSNSSYDSLKVKVASVSGGKTYKVYRSTSLKGTFTEVGSLTEAGTYKDTGLKTGKTYYYKVKACNSDGKCGSYSSIVSKKVIPGKAKFELTLGENKEVTVSVTEMEGSTGYAIYRSKYKNYGWTKVKNLTSGTEFSETLKKGTYYYKVRTYRTVNGTKVYGKYADVKSIKVK